MSSIFKYGISGEGRSFIIADAWQSEDDIKKLKMFLLDNKIQCSHYFNYDYIFFEREEDCVFFLLKYN